MKKINSTSRGIFTIDDIRNGTRWQYWTNSDGTKFFKQYFEYFKSCGWQAYADYEEIEEAEYRHKFSESVCCPLIF